MTPPGLPGWLRANRAGLIVLLALIPALIAVLVVIPAADRAGRIAAARDVPAGETVTVDGLTFSVRVAAEFTAEEDGLALPDETSLIAAIVDVAPAGTAADLAETCTISLSEPAGADRRVWEQVFGEARYGYERGADFADDCDARPTEAYSMELVFLTPSGVLDTSTVDIELRTGSRVETIRLALPAEV